MRVPSLDHFLHLADVEFHLLDSLLPWRLGVPGKREQIRRNVIFDEQ